MALSTFVTDGLQLAFADQGAGPVILCLAGLTRNMEDFEPAMPQLLSRARVIRLDSRGRGTSDHAPDFHSYTVMQEMQDAVALMDHLGIARFAVLGTSRGGLIAMIMAAMASTRLTGVVLNDIGPVIEAEGLTRIMDYLGLRPKFASLDAAAEALTVINAARFPGVSAAVWREHAARWWLETKSGLALRYDARLRDAALAQAKSTAPTPDLWPMFDALHGLPLAVLRGANSDLLSEATVDEMARHHPGLIRSTVANRGHVPFLDELESQAVLTEFLDRIVK